MNVGVLGGTFDPPHKAHIKIAERSIEQFNLNKVIFIPVSYTHLRAHET